jgi:hypothetical protein
MQVFLWSGMFLLFSIGGSAVGFAELIGMPMPLDVYAGVGALAAAFVVSGIALIVFNPAAPQPAPVELSA